MSSKRMLDGHHLSLKYMEEKNIPNYVLDVVNSMKTVGFNTEIEKKYNLTSKQIHQLAILEAKTLYKELLLNELPANVKERLNLDTRTANSITFDVCEKIFLPVKNYLSGVEMLMNKLKSRSLQPQNQNIVDLSNQ